MKIAHVIFAHGKPNQLERLVKSLVQEGGMVLIHLDLKSPLEDYIFLLDYEGVEFVEERHNVYWGGFSLVNAIMSSFRHLCRTDFQFDYLNLMSGQDFPIKPLREFYTFLNQNITSNYIEFYPPTHEWVRKEAERRIRRYFLTDYKFRGSTFLETLINGILPYKKMPENFKIIGHSVWLVLTNEAVNYLISYFDENPVFIRKFKYSWGADEFLLQSILYNSPFKDTIVNNNLRYIDWSEGKPSPKVLTISDIACIEKSSAYFARKFDEDIDEEVLIYLEDKINQDSHG